MNLLKLLFGGAAASAGTGRGCLQCGQCCEAFGGHLPASRADLERWRRLGREDLLARVSPAGYLWIDPSTGHIETACPHLRRSGPQRATCAINDVKPDTCRDYPTLAHGRRCPRGVFLGWGGLAICEAVEAALLLGSSGGLLT